jgi:hypothetical protein
MRSWNDTPPEVANLLNPAFCGQIIIRTVKAFMAEAGGKPMPYPLVFVILPLVLHGKTRQSIRGTTRHFQVWLNSDQSVKVGLANRARSLVPYTRQAVAFTTQTRALIVNETTAALTMGERLKTIRSRAIPVSDETKECLTKAEVLGKWFARANSSTTIYASLGLMP